MRPDEDSPGLRGFPKNWDVLHGSTRDDDIVDAPVPTAGSDRSPPTINVLASSWADVSSTLGVSTAALFGLNAAGHTSSLIALPWAVALGFIWWLAAATTLVAIRQGTPGMLLAGIVFSDRVAPRRVAAVIAAATVSALLGGLPGLLGARRSPLALAAAAQLESIPAT